MYKAIMELYKLEWQLFVNYWYVYVIGILVLTGIVLKYKNEIMAGFYEMSNSVNKYLENRVNKKI